MRRILSVVLGLLLLTTAVLKTQGPSDSLLSQNMILFSPRVQVAVIEAEVLLGLWLLSGWARRGAWLASLVFFLGVAGTSLHLGLAGQSSCGCFGRIPVSPWGAFGLDVACLAALALWRPIFTDGIRIGGFFQGLVKIGSGAVVVLVLIGGAFWLASDDPEEILSRLRGESITVEPRVSDLGEGIVGVGRTFSLQLTNHTDRTIRIVGGTSICSCITTENLPITLSKGEAKRINVTVKFWGPVGRFQHRFVLLTDEAAQGVVTAQFTGKVIDVRE